MAASLDLKNKANPTGIVATASTERTTPGEKVFTTIENAATACFPEILKSGFSSMVFFAPHTRAMWNGYNTALRSGDPEVLHRRWGMRVGIVQTTAEQMGRIAFYFRSAAIRALFQILSSVEASCGAFHTGSVVPIHYSMPKGSSPRRSSQISE